MFTPGTCSFQNVPHIEGMLGVERECPGLAIKGSSE